MPVKHVVMFGFQTETTAEDIEAFRQGLLSLPSKISQIQAHELGNDLKLPSGLNHPMGPNRTLLWSVTFANADDYVTYDTCEAHKELVGRFKHMLSQRAAIQYEC